MKNPDAGSKVAFIVSRTNVDPWKKSWSSFMSTLFFHETQGKVRFPPSLARSVLVTPYWRRTGGAPWYLCSNNDKIRQTSLTTSIYVTKCIGVPSAKM